MVIRKECIDILLEHARLPSKISGSFFDKGNTEIPIVGITGFGNEYSRAGKRSTWIHGEILSPSFIGNDGCACRSHIEGIITDTGNLHLLEQVYNFPACEGDSFEYLLNYEESNEIQLKFKGSLISRRNRNNFIPQKTGEIYLEINPFWSARMNEGGKSRNYSLPYNKRHFTIGSYIPHFLEEFLGQVEDLGYDHPYESVTGKLIEERNEKKKRLVLENAPVKPESEDVPF